MEMNTLQKLINKRAEQKLNAAINALWNTAYNSGLLGYYKDMPRVYIKTEKGEYWDREVNDIFNPSQQTMKQIYAANLPRYIEEETKLFLKEIEDTRSRIESLESEIGNIYSAIPQ